MTVSDKGYRGEREDASGPLLCGLLAEMGAQVIEPHLIPDEADQIAMLLARLADSDGVDLVLTTGGAGPSPRDVTPEATRAVIEREMPGLAELLRWDGYQRTPFAVLSRGVAGIRGRTLIVNLPGSPKAVREGMEVLAPLLPAVVALIKDEAPVDGLCAPQIVELVIPIPLSGTGAGLARVARTAQDQPIVSAAAVLSTLDGKCTHARLALAGVARRPTRLPEVEEMLIGQALRVEDLAGISGRIRALVDPISDFRAGADYRREMAGIVGRRALHMACEQTMAGGEQ